METIQQQLNALQTSVKRQRFAIIALAGVIVAGGFIAAVRQNNLTVISGFESQLGTLLITNDGQVWQYNERQLWMEDSKGPTGEEIIKAFKALSPKMQEMVDDKLIHLLDPKKRYMKRQWRSIESPTSYN